MEWGLTLLQLKTLVTAGLATWLSMAVGNNIIDPGTNIHLLTQMMSMAELKQDGVLGQRLLWRRVEAAWTVRLVLLLVIFAQVAVALLLWRATFLLGWTPDAKAAVSAANLGVGSFAGLWFVFLTGGMWFGYWMKMVPVQQVHMALLAIAVATLILINL